MHKTMLAALIVATSALSVPALAQVNLGGAARVGAGANAGAVSNTAHGASQTGAQAGETLHRTDRHAKRTAHQTTDKTRAAAAHSRRAKADVNAGNSTEVRSGSTRADANADVNADAHVDTGGAASRAGQTGQGVGGLVSDTAHSAIQATDRTAGSVGDAVKQTATEQSVGADAKVDARAAEHGH